MTPEETRRLLGDYATDALTPEERRTLFQAALDDPELFHALANEDALKELLDDPVTRAQVRAAMQPRRRQFHPRRWLLGVAIPAVVAVVLVVMMNRAGAPRLVATNQAPPAVSAPVAAPQVAPVPAQAAPVAPAPRPPKRSLVVARPSLKTFQAEAVAPKPQISPASPPPALESPAPLAQRDVVAPALATLRAPGPPPIPEAIRQEFAAGFPAGAPLYQGPLVQYSLIRSGPEGRAVRVQVTTGIAGYLALYEVDAAGNAARVYPAGDVAGRILPNLPEQIPPAPVEIREAGAKLRLVVVQAPIPAANGFLPATQGAVAGAVASAPVPAPMVVEIPLAP